MQFNFVLTILAAVSTVAAIPTGGVFIRSTCSVGKCLAALGPTGVSCGTAALELGKNGAKDAACLAASVNNAANVPAPCHDCLGEIGVKSKIKAAGHAVEHVAHDAKGGLKNLIHKAGSKIKHLASTITGKRK